MQLHMFLTSLARIRRQTVYQRRLLREWYPEVGDLSPLVGRQKTNVHSTLARSTVSMRAPIVRIQALFMNKPLVAATNIDL